MSNTEQKDLRKRFVEHINCQLQEYVIEAEHQEGEEYWNQFDEVYEIVQDFTTYLEVDMINASKELGKRDLRHIDLMLMNHKNYMQDELEKQIKEYKDTYGTRLLTGCNLADDLTNALDDVAEVLKDIETCEHYSRRIQFIINELEN